MRTASRSATRLPLRFRSPVITPGPAARYPGHERRGLTNTPSQTRHYGRGGSRENRHTHSRSFCARRCAISSPCRPCCASSSRAISSGSFSATPVARARKAHGTRITRCRVSRCEPR
eukprot:1935916-Prymnesium_polylepis.2